MKCQFMKLDSTQCNANAMMDTKFCFTHNPEAQDEKKTAVLKGGLAPKPRKDAELLIPIQVKTIEGVLTLIEDTINRVRTEPMTHQKANCIGYLANIALKALEVGEIDEKLDLVNSIILERRTKIRK